MSNEHNLKDVQSLKFEQLLEAIYLYGVRNLDPALENEINKTRTFKARL